MNGAAARLVQKGNTVIIIAYALIKEESILNHQPSIAIRNEKNKIIEFITEKQNLLIEEKLIN